MAHRAELSEQRGRVDAPGADLARARDEHDAHTKQHEGTEEKLKGVVVRYRQLAEQAKLLREKHAELSETHGAQPRRVEELEGELARKTQEQDALSQGATDTAVAHRAELSEQRERVDAPGADLARARDEHDAQQAHQIKQHARQLDELRQQAAAALEENGARVKEYEATEDKLKSVVWGVAGGVSAGRYMYRGAHAQLRRHLWCEVCFSAL